MTSNNRNTPVFVRTVTMGRGGACLAITASTVSIAPCTGLEVTVSMQTLSLSVSSMPTYPVVLRTTLHGVLNLGQHMANTF